jgi:pyruvate-formate lyase-activating enzyme
MPKKTKTDLFFYLNLFCNDKCNFCFFSNLPPRQNFLRLGNVKKVIQKVPTEKIRGIILTGGEPTLNPQFWNIIGYLYDVFKAEKIEEFNLSTNAITSADEQVAERLEKYFRPFGKDRRGVKISFSFSSFTNIKGGKAKIANEKIRGIRNLMAIDGNVECVITVTGDNYQRIFDATKLLISFYKNKSKKYSFKIDYRLPYTSMIHQIDDLGELAAPFEGLSVNMNKALGLARKEGIYVTLHNIPSCYIKDKPEYFIGRMPPKGIAVFPDKKTGFIKRKKLFKFDKDSRCRGCRLNQQCSGLERIYLEKCNYPPFKIFN